MVDMLMSEITPLTDHDRECDVRLKLTSDILIATARQAKIKSNLFLTFPSPIIPTSDVAFIFSTVI